MNKNANKILADALNQMGNESPDATTIKAAADRVWARVVNEENVMAMTNTAQAEQLRDCHDFQTLIPAYLHGQLTAARVMLLEDHTRECFNCRKALKAARTGDAVQEKIAVDAPKHSWFSFKQPAFRFAFAAVLVVTLGLGAWPLLERIFNSLKVFNAVVMAANGPLYRVTDKQNQLVPVGAKIERGEKIRTAKGASAVVKLPDGSLVEMAERAEFSLTDNPEGTTINLHHGNVIVQAAKQRNKHLYVKTDDSLVSVVGTIFSVNNGTKGSRVSVVEGEVHVEHDGKDNKLLPGDQITTSASIEPLAIKSEIAWSRDASRYDQLLDEVAKLRKDIQALPRPGVRNSTHLLDVMPEGTVFYMALPNLSETLNSSYDLVKQRIDQNPELQSWWKNQNSKEADKLFGKLREFGSYLGAEITLSSELNNQGHPSEPIIIAELTNAGGLRDALEQLPNQPVQIVDDPATATAEKGKDAFAWLRGDFVAITHDLARLQKFAVSLSGANRFKETSFYNSIAKRYQEGTSVIVAADLEKIAPQIVGKNEKEQIASEQLGLTNFKHFVAEIKDGNAKAQNSAELTFKEANKGIAAWLAAPAPMGSLSFISADANIVGAFVVKDPTAMADNLINALKAVDPGFGEHLAKFESTHGVSVRNDIAAPLGGEFAFALDGPVVPTPSWKIIVEVYDQTKMQETLDRMVSEVNRTAQEHGKKGFELNRTGQSGRIYYAIKSLDLDMTVNYVYANGYFVAAPSIALLDRALRYRDSGFGITSSPRFIASLPADKQANFSAMLYQNLAPLVDPIAKNLSNLGGDAKAGKFGALSSLANGAPSLAYAYSFGDRITLSVNTENGALNLGDILSLPGSMAMHQMIHGAIKN